MGSLKQLSYNHIYNLSFGVYSDEDIEKLSILPVTSENSLNALGHPIPNGIYDPHLGPMSMDGDFCKTCHGGYFKCNGHCAHIDLPLPVFNAFFIDVIKGLLTLICPKCYRFQVKASRGITFTYETLLCSLGYHLQALELSDFMSQFMFTPDEAAEETNEKGQSSQEEETIVLALHKKLKRKVAEIRKNETPCEKNTSNSEAAAIQIRKKFINDTRITKKSQCRFCQADLEMVLYSSSQMVRKAAQSTKGGKSGGKKGKSDFELTVAPSQPYITPTQAQNIFRECYVRDGHILNNLYPFLKEANSPTPTDLFFIRKLLVTPPRFRPPIRLGHGRFVESDLSVLYKTVLEFCKSLRFLSRHKDNLGSIPDEIKASIAEFKGDTVAEKCHGIWKALQATTDNILDSEISPSLNQVTLKGIRQVVEKKVGLFRQNLMGKRVNFSARSVAAPDPLLDVDEVGVPLDFALHLTYPVNVTPWNVAHLRTLVENGPLCYPGAVMVEDEEGKRITLKANDEKQRIAIAKSLLTPPESCVSKVNATKIVYRHLKNGDYVLMNRQPTLHKPSIQAHRAHIMPNDRVLRMPYANCKAYNADFDGDELNLHFPQSEMARSETEHIVASRNQYLTLKDGSPLAGLIQDNIVSNVMLTVRGKFFSREDYHQLVFISLGNKVRKLQLLQPAIQKPTQLWSGKQIISTILINLIPEKEMRPSFNFKTTVKKELWQNSDNPHTDSELSKILDSMTESSFIMTQGELLCGIVDKCAIGSTLYGLIHVIFELCGSRLACELLTALNRLSVVYLQWSGHTISLKEFVTSSLASRRRRKTLKKLIEKTEMEVANRLGISQDGLRQHFETIHKLDKSNDNAALDAAYTAVLGPATSTITMDNEKRIIHNGLRNRMRMMVDTGAKGSKVNMNQMSSLFGSIAVDGKRMPLSIAGKTLPGFKFYDCDPRAGGYIPARFVTGMDPRSYFFLCIVGRDSLQHTAVKTSNSGYMQRCLIKHLEGIKVEYDGTVRNSDGLVLQFEYGEDGMDVGKMPFLANSESLDIFLPNFMSRINQSEMDIVRNTKNSNCKKYKKEVTKSRKTGASKNTRRSPFLTFCRDKVQTSIKSEHKISAESVFSRTREAVILATKWNNLSQGIKDGYIAENRQYKRIDPLNSVYNGSLTFGVVSEALEDMINDYYDIKCGSHLRNGHKSALSKKEVQEALYLKAFKSRVEPGEAVGALCAQAIGEPLTQMTLNTFHFAGRDELNVTLGVPRMIEILRIASDQIKTPIMEVPFKNGVSESTANKLKLALTPVSLKNVLHKCDISTWIQRDEKLLRYACIKFHFLPRSEYKDTYAVRPESVLARLEHFFIRRLCREIEASINQANLYATSSRAESREDGNGEQDENGANDLSKEKSFAALVDNLDSSDEEEDDPAAAAADDDVATSKRQASYKEQDYSDDNDADPDDVYDELDKRVIKKPRPDSEDENSNQDSKNAPSPEEEKDDSNKPPPENSDYLKETKSTKKKGKSAALPLSQNKYLKRISFVKNCDQWVKHYDFDRDNNLWCEVTLAIPIAEGKYDLSSIVRNLSETTSIHHVPGIKKALIVRNDDGLLLRTEGVNIFKMYSYEHILDIDRFYTNNIKLMGERYGIEAVQRCIIKEINAVQSAYDIKVDFRHLSLLADYFTREGVYKACSRFDLASCSSPIQKMSYETCFSFMQKALLAGKTDDMSSPSAKVMVGQPVAVGTNTMRILYRLNSRGPT